uniref:Uncharacterized protein n=1 Tax=Anguilla anguilla TaxID=7936 RepID=A0A0E9RSU5_ANGAN
MRQCSGTVRNSHHVPLFPREECLCLPTSWSKSIRQTIYQPLYYFACCKPISVRRILC